MITDLEVLQSQAKQQRENVRVWKEGYEREEAKLTEMRNLIAIAEAGVPTDGSED